MRVDSIPLPDGRTLSYGDVPARSPLLLVHGWPLDRSIWDAQLGAFGSERRIVAPDLAGFGDSRGKSHTSVEAHADDLAQLVERLGLDGFVLAGLSMGGYIALAYARRYPERLAGLVLADSRAEPDDEAARAGRAASIELVRSEGLGALAGRLVGRLLAEEASPSSRDGLSAMILRQDPEAVTAALTAMAERPDARPALGEIRVPTLVVVGALDVVTPPAAAEAMAGAIPGARLVVVPGAGHLSNFEEPGAFNAALRAFLAEVDAAAAP
jgi:pimeloyl-ACP methyl ester carboxylesterase